MRKNVCQVSANKTRKKTNYLIATFSTKEQKKSCSDTNTAFKVYRYHSVIGLFLHAGSFMTCPIHIKEITDIFPTLKKRHFVPIIYLYHIRRFRNKCDIVEEPNYSSKYGIRMKFFSLITRNLVF